MEIAGTGAPKMTTLKEMKDLPMPLFKNALKKEFFNLQKLYLQEEKRHGKGLLFMDIKKEEKKFDVTYYPAKSIPESNGLKKILLNNDDNNFLNIMGQEDGKIVTLRLEKK